jgi:putative ABC transport system ATP-binding protein
VAGQRQTEQAAKVGVAASDAPIFTARGLTKIYRAGEVAVQALRGLDLDLYPHEFAVFLGPSGSGKSTLFIIRGGLDCATAGSARFKDLELTGLSDAALTRYRRRSVGFVFQFYNLVPSLTALENVALATEIAVDPMRPHEVLEMVGLADRAHHFPAQLSGGEQQRVAIARAIAKRPEVLLCDEPTGALDVATGIRVLEALAFVNETLGAATAVITHNVAIAEMAHRVLYFRDGLISRVERNAMRKRPGELAW